MAKVLFLRCVPAFAVVALAFGGVYGQEQAAGQGTVTPADAQQGVVAPDIGQETQPPGGAAPEAAVESPLAPEAPSSLALSLAQAVATALRNSLDMRVLAYQPKIVGTDIDRQDSQFDPLFSGAVSYAGQRPPYRDSTNREWTGGPVTVSEMRSKTASDVTSYQAGMSVRSTYGGLFSVSALSQRSDVELRSIFTGAWSRQNQDYYQTEWIFQLSQPLLKNAGEIANRAGVRIAQNNTKVSFHEFQEQVMGLVLDTSVAYWNLAFRREDMKVKEKSLQAAQDLLKNNTAKWEAGVLPRIEVTRARARVAEREEAVVLAKAAIKDAEDRLRGILASQDADLLSTTDIVPTDQPSVYAEQIDVDSAVHTALSIRPAVRRQVITLESYGIVMARAKHQLLPQVDIDATYALNGIDNSFAGSVEVLDHNAASAGITLTVPWGNRLARADYMKAVYQRQQGLAGLRSLQKDITLAVKKAARDISTSLQSIETNRLRKQAAQENLDAEIQKYQVGESISLDVLDAQDQLQQAETAYLASLIGFNAAMDNYYRTVGLILQKYGIEVVEQATIKRDTEILSQ